MSPRHPAVKFLAWVERLGYLRADLIVGTMPNLREHVVEVSGSDKPVAQDPQGLGTSFWNRQRLCRMVTLRLISHRVNLLSAMLAPSVLITP